MVPMKVQISWKGSRTKKVIKAIFIYMVSKFVVEITFMHSLKHAKIP